ncbi:hypothetical protein TWF730_004413 [Orbilia blumenaviensis]|uniref:Peptidase M20 dimerisation domain-containing protein n=1 Tax=Orbilia blumenaviensis TaxID=1796055 RepID=A0AAV9U1L2_9PEZI
MGNPEVLPHKDNESLAEFWQRHDERRGRYRKYFRKLLPLLGITVLGAAFYITYISSFRVTHCKAAFSILSNKFPYAHKPQTHIHRRKKVEELCPLVEPIFPEYTRELEHLEAHLRTREYALWSAKALGGAIKIRTDVFDDFGPVGRDPRWSRMDKYSEYLRDTFPLIHEKLAMEYINGYGLIYTLKGSNEDLKPILLLAHQDVVPVSNETLDEWDHGPWSGDFDGRYIWGRGAIDDKNQLIALMESIELLLHSQFRPSRTVVLAFGFDEEVGGGQGAQFLGQALYSDYGRNGFATIIDEGTAMIDGFGSQFLVISTAEKGFMNQQISIKTPGGHASMPPKHTSIGIMAEIIVALENNPFERELSDDNPLKNFIDCAAAWADDFPDELRRYIENEDKKSLADALVEWDLRYDADLRTTTAVTAINGGTKVNALPEFVIAGMNHRIRRGSSTWEVTNATERIVSEIAKKYGLEVIAYPEDGAEYPESSITIQAYDRREPSPLTSSRVDIQTAFKIVAGTTRAVFGEDLIVTPGLNMGNTDTFWYTKLSENIFRYAPMPLVKKNMHSTNEHVSLRGHLGMVHWFVNFILNMDTLEDTYW